MKFHFTLKFHTAEDSLGAYCCNGRCNGLGGGSGGGSRPRPGSNGSVWGSGWVLGSDYSASVFLLQQRPGVVGSRWSGVVVLEVELVVLPPIEPLDAVVELGNAFGSCRPAA